MRIERADYVAALAERRYQECDLTNRLVAGTLERRWNEALLGVEQIKNEAAQFQSQKSRVATQEQKAKVLALAGDLPRLWQAPTTQARDRKRMLRLLIRDITVEKLTDRRQLVLHVRWQGGSCSDTNVDLPKPVAEAIRYPAAVVEQVRELAQRLSDLQIVAYLNQEEQRSPHGKAFTLPMIKWVRHKYAILHICLAQPDELTVKQLANNLEVSTHIVYYWLERGIVQARKLDGGTWRISVTAAKTQELQDWGRTSGHLQAQHANIQL